MGIFLPKVVVGKHFKDLNCKPFMYAFTILKLINFEYFLLIYMILLRSLQTKYNICFVNGTPVSIVKLTKCQPYTHFQKNSKLNATG